MLADSEALGSALIQMRLCLLTQKLVDADSNALVLILKRYLLVRLTHLLMLIQKLMCLLTQRRGDADSGRFVDADSRR